MIRYDVALSEPAEAELDAAFDYLFLRSPDYAFEWRDQFEAALVKLEEMPQRYAYAPENDHYPIDIRQIWFGKGGSQHRLVFTIIEPEGEHPGIVRILRVRHAAQSPI